jgi:AraC-like DNA-binding protein
MAAEAMPRALIVRDESELGRLRRAIRRPNPELRSVLHRDLLGLSVRGAGFASLLEPPRLALRLTVDIDGAIAADSAALPDAWLGGLSGRYAIVELGAEYTSLDLELTPLGAYTVLGRPLRELAETIATLEDLFGRDGHELAERMREAPGWNRRFALIEAFLTERARSGPQPSPAVAWALARLHASGGRARIGALAGEIACSRRPLHTLFCEQVGLPPKTVARVLRFEHLRRALDANPSDGGSPGEACGRRPAPISPRRPRAGHVDSSAPATRPRRRQMTPDEIRRSASSRRRSTATTPARSSTPSCASVRG